VDFAFSEEQEAFRDTLRRFLEADAPMAEVRRIAETGGGHDPALWARMAGELGLAGVHVPEAYGGQGFGLLELGIVQHELGRALTPSPFFASACLAANALLCAGSEPDKKDLLPGIASGEVVATLALGEAEGGFDPAAVTATCERRGDGFAVRGVKRWVPHGAQADLVLVVARRPGSAGGDGLSLLAVRPADGGVTATPVETLDTTRPMAHLDFDAAPARGVGAEGGAGPALRRALSQAQVALACEMVGGAERCLEMAVDYARERVQFGRPIGSFQAIKHRCAELLLEVEEARVAATWASWVASQDSDELARAASLAKALCGDAFLQAAADNLHVHGGMGFTWEADPHLYLKRARASAALLGDSIAHRRELADLLGL